MSGMMEKVDPAHVFEVFRYLCRGLDPFDLVFEQKKDVYSVHLLPSAGPKIVPCRPATTQRNAHEVPPDSNQTSIVSGPPVTNPLTTAPTHRKDLAIPQEATGTKSDPNLYTPGATEQSTASLPRAGEALTTPTPHQHDTTVPTEARDKHGSSEATLGDRLETGTAAPSHNQDGVSVQASSPIKQVPAHTKQAPAHTKQAPAHTKQAPAHTKQAPAHTAARKSPDSAHDSSLPIAVAVHAHAHQQAHAPKQIPVHSSSPHEHRELPDGNASVSAISLSPVPQPQSGAKGKPCGSDGVRPAAPGLALNGSVNASVLGGFVFSASALSSTASSVNRSALHGKRRLNSLTPAAERKRRDLTAFDFDEDELDQSILFRRQIIEKNQNKGVTPQIRLQESMIRGQPQGVTANKSTPTQHTAGAAVPLLQQPARPPAAPPNQMLATAAGVSTLATSNQMPGIVDKNRTESPDREHEPSVSKKPSTNQLDFAFNMRVFSSDESSSNDDGALSDGSTELNRQAHLMLNDSP